MHSWAWRFWQCAPISGGSALWRWMDFNAARDRGPPPSRFKLPPPAVGWLCPPLGEEFSGLICFPNWEKPPKSALLLSPRKWIQPQDVHQPSRDTRNKIPPMTLLLVLLLVAVQVLICVQLFSTHGLQHARLPVLHSLPELAQTYAIQPSHPLSPPSPPAFHLSQHQHLFQWSALHIRWSQYWSLSFSSNPSSEYSRLISFRIEWCVLSAVQGAL